jgi:hypothetical protein
MKSIKIGQCGIFPVVYDQGILFNTNNKLYLWKDNSLLNINITEIDEVYYPETIDEVQMLLNVIDLIYLRIQTTSDVPQEFTDHIIKIKLNQEKIKKELLKGTL